MSGCYRGLRSNDTSMVKVYPSNNPFSLEFDDKVDGLDNNKNRNSYKQGGLQNAELFHGYWLLTIKSMQFPIQEAWGRQGAKNGWPIGGGSLRDEAAIITDASGCLQLTISR